MSFKKVFFKNIVGLAKYTYTSQIISFVSTIATARLILPESFGLIALITVFTGFINVFLDSGISMAVIRSGYGFTYYKGLHSLTCLISILLCAFTLVMLYPISLFYKNPNLILPGSALGILFIFKSLSIVPIAILQKQMEFIYVAKVLFIGTIINITLTILMALLGWQAWALIWPQYISTFCIFFILNQKTKIPLLHVKRAIVANSFLKTKSLIGNLVGFNLINYWSRNADNLLVGKVYGATDLGIYSRAYSMLTLPLSFITGIFSSVLYPSLVKLSSQGGNVQSEYYFVLRIISALSLPLAVILLAYPKEFVNILWGDRWTEVIELLPYFGLLVLTQTLLSTVGSLLVLEKKEKAFMYSGWISAFFIITGIGIGSFISLKGIAAFYSLFYIAFVLVYHVFWIYYKCLKQPLSIVLPFWVPKIVLSILMWFGIYSKNKFLLFSGLVMWVLMLIIDNRFDIKILAFYFFKRFYKSKLN